MFLQVINGGKVCTENPILSNRSSSQLHKIYYICPLGDFPKAIWKI